MSIVKRKWKLTPFKDENGNPVWRLDYSAIRGLAIIRTTAIIDGQSGVPSLAQLIWRAKTEILNEVEK